MLSNSYYNLASNTGLSAYLDSIAGLNYRDTKVTNVKRFIQDVTGSSLGGVSARVQSVEASMKQILQSNKIVGNLFTGF
jgi:hypothetical protein